MTIVQYRQYLISKYHRRKNLLNGALRILKSFLENKWKYRIFFVKADKSDPTGIKRKLLISAEASKKSKEKAKITNFLVARSINKSDSSTSLQPDAELANRVQQLVPLLLLCGMIFFYP